MSALLHITGLDRVVRNLASTGRQLRFATALAVNDTARDVQALALGQLLPGAFTLRSRGQPWQKPGGKFGFNIRPYASASSLNPTATVGSQADWLKEQEAGGTKKVSGHRLAVPTGFWKDKQEIMARQKKPRAVLRARKALEKIAGRAWMVPDHSGKLGPGIWARTTAKRLPIVRLFSFTESARVKGVLHYEPKGAALATARFPAHFATRFARAIATAR